MATLNKQMPTGYKLIELSELCCEDASTFSENHLPTHRQLVLDETKRKRERETRGDELAAYEPRKARGHKRLR